LVGLLVTLAMLSGMLVLSPGVARAAPPQFVQTRAKEIRSGATNALAFNSANTAGNLVVVYVVWSNTNAVTVSDSRGNTYAAALGRTTWGSGWRDRSSCSSPPPPSSCSWRA